ncbi:hypothetical protein ES702_05243 [subsurface metagenome]
MVLFFFPKCGKKKWQALACLRQTGSLPFVLTDAEMFTVDDLDAFDDLASFLQVPLYLGFFNLPQQSDEFVRDGVRVDDDNFRLVTTDGYTEQIGIVSAFAYCF